MALGVLRNEGVLGFWRGNGLNVLRTAPYKVGAAADAAPSCAPCKLVHSGAGPTVQAACS